MPIIEGLNNLLNDLEGWMFALVVPFIVIQAIFLGFKLTSTDDPHEEKSMKKKFLKVIIGAAVIGTAPWIGSQITGYFM